MIIKPSITVAAVILCAVSIALPAAHWASLPTDATGQWLAGITGAAIAVCKLGFFPVAFSHLAARRWLPAAALLPFAIALLWLNVDATHQLLAGYQQQRQTQTVQSSEQWQRLQHNLEEINRSIATVNGLRAADLANGYRQRAYDAATELESLRQKRRDLQQQLKAIQKPAILPAQARKTENADAGTEKTTSGLYRITDSLFITALSIHIGCVLAVLVCSVWRMEEPAKTATATVKKSTARARPAEKTKPPAAKAAPGQLTPEQQTLAARIEAGEYSDTPGMKSLIEAKAIPGGYRKIKPVFDHLIAKGALEQVGQRFQLKQKTI